MDEQIRVGLRILSKLDTLLYEHVVDDGHEEAWQDERYWRCRACGSEAFTTERVDHTGECLFYDVQDLKKAMNA